MAFFQGTIRSGALGMDTQLQVVLPYDRPGENQASPCKTLYLLHGLGDNSSAWCRYTNIERYARDWGIAVVMPEVQRSFYGDMRHGLKYFTYITEELPELCEKLFRLSTQRRDSFIAGLSMGGYGALKCGLGCPERYAGCASFSGVLDIYYILKEQLDGQHLAEIQGLLGMELTVDERDDLFALATKVHALPAGDRPDIFITCGKQDFLYQTNADFTAHLRKLPLDFTYHEWDGEHEWGFWDKSVQMALEFFLRR